MPYGARDLEAVARDYLSWAVLLASLAWFTAFYSAVLTTRLWPRPRIVVTAVRGWVFKPALSNNRPVAVWVAVPVRFTLRSR